MTLLELAIKARLPLIAIRTKDPFNIGKVLNHYAGEDVLEAPQGKAIFQPAEDALYCAPSHHTMDLTFMYGAAAKRNASLIIVNPDELHPAAFDAGEVLLPDSVITEFVRKYADEGSDRYALTAALRGLSFKEMVEVTKLAMAECEEFTAESVLRIRRQRTVLSNGLQLVDTAAFFYQPQEDLTRWLDIDGRLFTANVPKVVRPRGLLFKGEPGTGKTSGAKYLADNLGLPLYLLDVGSTMQKYVGESERTFSAALAQIETLAPAVVLFDEVEKIFGHEDDSGVSRRVLGMLLWWLQEHSSQVLTIMTTNDESALPSELIRPGRIDRHFTFYPLTQADALQFAEALRKSLTNVCNVSKLQVENAVSEAYKRSGVARSQAELTQIVIECVKVKLAAGLKE